MIKDENFINIQGWMVSKLKLKGNELLIYAIIYGFTQDGQTRFNGGLSYLAEWTNSTKQGVLKALKSLKDKGLIEKQETILNGVKFVEWYATKFNGGIKQSLTGIKQSLPNNINNNIYINNNINKKDCFAKKDEKMVLIEEGIFYIDDTMDEYKEVLEGMADADIEKVWKWIFENKQGQEVPQSWIIERIKQFKRGFVQ